jgi:hypothetical protein
MYTQVSHHVEILPDLIQLFLTYNHCSMFRFFLIREWENNKESLIHFMEQVHMGIKERTNAPVLLNIQSLFYVQVLPDQRVGEQQGESDPLHGASPHGYQGNN